MSQISRLLTILILTPLIYGAAFKLGFNPPLASPLPYWASAEAHLSIGGTTWLTLMGVALLVGSQRILSNLLGFALVLCAMAATFIQDGQMLLTIGIAVGALLAFVLRSPSAWSKLYLVTSLIAIACLLIGRYA